MEAHVEALAELRRIYGKADEEARGNPALRCELSGRCCRFREAGHVLFVTRLEYDEMVRCGGAPGAGEEGVCPWLRGGLCGNREGRALACRTYFCSDEAAAAALTERHHREIRRLHERHGIPYDYRPLHGHAR
ncbi:MAG: hypothetical protein L6Q95_10460 [Planctomycetes bacterium]|nr:hypothetical protein [Planctomycetota bacterium]